MNTNGESARAWLEDKNNYITEKRVNNIRKKLITKIEETDPTNAQHEGLIEALHVIEDFLLQYQDKDHIKTETNINETPLDYGLLIDHHSEQKNVLSSTEKRRRFQQLMCNNQYPLKKS